MGNSLSLLWPWLQYGYVTVITRGYPFHSSNWIYFRSHLRWDQRIKRSTALGRGNCRQMQDKLMEHLERCQISRDCKRCRLPSWIDCVYKFLHGNIMKISGVAWTLCMGFVRQSMFDFRSMFISGWWRTSQTRSCNASRKLSMCTVRYLERVFPYNQVINHWLVVWSIFYVSIYWE